MTTYRRLSDTHPYVEQFACYVLEIKGRGYKVKWREFSSEIHEHYFDDEHSACVFANDLVRQPHIVISDEWGDQTYEELTAYWADVRHGKGEITE